MGKGGILREKQRIVKLTVERRRMERELLAVHRDQSTDSSFPEPLFALRKLSGTPSDSKPDCILRVPRADRETTIKAGIQVGFVEYYWKMGTTESVRRMLVCMRIYVHVSACVYILYLYSASVIIYIYICTYFVFKLHIHVYVFSK